VTGALNTRSTVVLRLLTWQSPSLPLGAWMAAAAAGGGALSAAGTALALRGPGPGLRRRIDREPRREEPWEGSATNVQRPWARTSRPVEEPREISDPPTWRQPTTAGPDRAPGEPPPTLSVPYRVIRQGRRESPSAPMGSPHRPEPVPASDDWGSETMEDW